jgi:hypothetical protein
LQENDMNRVILKDGMTMISMTRFLAAACCGHMATLVNLDAGPGIMEFSPFSTGLKECRSPHS